MAFGWDDAALAGLLIGDYIYHRYLDEPPKPTPQAELTLPRVDDGAPYPILYGRCRVKQPVIAWCDRALYEALPETGDPTNHYFMSMLLVLGIPFDGGDQKLLSMYFGDKKYVHGSYYDFSDLSGDNSVDYPAAKWASVEDGIIGPNTRWPAGAFGGVEFLNGRAGQTLVDNTTPYTARTYAGKHMTQATSTGSEIQDLYGTIDPRDVPGYRGFLSAFLFNNTDTVTDTGFINHWCVGDGASVDQYSFEVQTLPASYLGPNQSVMVHDGDITEDQGDANPIDVLYDVLTGTKGKLALPTTRIDTTSFAAAASTLDDEGNGFSYAFVQGDAAKNIVDMILRQIDGVIYEDPVDGLIKVKLVRNDYDPASIPTIGPGNCVDLKNFSAGGWTDVPNKIRVTYSNRQDNYSEASGVAHNQANALGQDGEVREIQIAMPGVCSQPLADAIAARELGARSRPLLKCRAICDRSMRNIVPGDVVNLTWPPWKLSSVVMRVAAVNRGTVGSNTVALDLIQDYYYVWKARPPVSVVSGRPTSGGIL